MGKILINKIENLINNKKKENKWKIISWNVKEGKNTLKFKKALKNVFQ